jgi:hypothetical protein
MGPNTRRGVATALAVAVRPLTGSWERALALPLRLPISSLMAALRWAAAYFAWPPISTMKCRRVSQRLLNRAYEQFNVTK